MLRVSDPVFSPRSSGLNELIEQIDVDSVGDIEVMLMYLLGYRVELVEHELGDEDDGAELVPVLYSESGHGVGSPEEYPLNMLYLVRAACSSEELLLCQDDVELTEHTAAQRLAGMNDDELIAALYDALGFLRVFLLAEDDLEIE